MQTIRQSNGVPPRSVHQPEGHIRLDDLACPIKVAPRRLHVKAHGVQFVPLGLATGSRERPSTGLLPK